MKLSEIETAVVNAVEIRMISENKEVFSTKQFPSLRVKFCALLMQTHVNLQKNNTGLEWLSAELAWKAADIPGIQYNDGVMIWDIKEITKFFNDNKSLLNASME